MECQPNVKKHAKKESRSLFRTMDFFMLRTPLLPIDMFLELCQSDWKLDKLDPRKQDIIRECIAVASPSLIESLNKREKADREQLEQVARSCLRYVIRMSTRATPFGLFSGVACGYFDTNTNLIVNKMEQHKKRSRPDMEWLLKIVQSLEENLDVVKQLHVQTNTMYEIVGNRVSLPYITRYGQKHDGYQIENVSIAMNDLIALVFNKATEPVPFMELLQIIKESYPDTEDRRIESFLFQLVKNEFLLTSLRPRLTHTSPFDQLLAVLKRVDGIDELYQQLLTIRQDIIAYDQLEIGQGETHFLSTLFKMKSVESSSSQLQVDLSLSTEQVTLPKSIAKDLSKAAELLWRLSPNHVGWPHLTEYRDSFIERYGFEREVPLLELLDENRGLGAPATYENPISKRNYLPSSRDKINEKALLQLLSHSLLTGSREIELTDELIEKLEPVSPKWEHVPLSMELYASLFATSTQAMDNGDYTIHIGGNTGSTLAGKSFGRFADILGESIEENLEQINQEHQQAYPDSIFAEVVYFPRHGRAANVVLSKSKREYEILIGTPSYHSKSIPLSDLVVRATSHSFYLKSRSLNKEVIPVTGHMLNYTGSVPNVYRFLSELGMGKQRNWMPFSWGSFRHGPVLPRLRYGKIILSPATWNVDQELLSVSKKDGKERWMEAVQNWIGQYQVPDFVYITDYDNKMLLDLKNERHLVELIRELQMLNSGQTLVLTEVGAELKDCVVEGKDGAFHMECVFPLVKNTPIEATATETGSVENGVQSNRALISDQERLKMPGSDWLFYKLYCDETRMDEFIAFPLQSLCKGMRTQGVCQKIFFMRYADPKPHIRLRFQAASTKGLQSIFSEMYQWTSDMQKQGYLSKTTIDTYDPEIERYGGPQLISLAEEIFAVDSMVVAHLLQQHRTKQMNMPLEKVAVISIIDLLHQFLHSIDEKLHFLNRMIQYKAYLDDFRTDRVFYLKAGRYTNDWQELKGLEDGLMLHHALQIRSAAIKSFSRVMRSLKAQSELYNSQDQIIGSIIHLHINRLLGVEREREKKVMTLARHTLHNLRYFLLQEESRTKEAVHAF
ncbi:thiopeptide-type bacteriocin biosynthesis protein [Brevibacillus sp. AG162]|uniref:lantibiotic dehydratase n=1 Tax=Brevibacillus sp. AG162 TaxID=2572910 RepID=UPI00115425AE|nr:lantibiotic dehydratase [Brevibacillus sp. AG162]TQK75174.1 thiopeptide-type bacteriocin biosynthesis protein [Brevibacillus sp. AG162]